MMNKQNQRHVNTLRRWTLTTTAAFLIGTLATPVPYTAVHAEDSSETTDTVKDQFDVAKQEINALPHLNTDYQQSFLTLLRTHQDSPSTLDTIVAEAQKADTMAKSASTESTKRPQVDTIDQLIEKLNEKVDTHQQESTETPTTEDAKPVDELNAILHPNEQETVTTDESETSEPSSETTDTVERQTEEVPTSEATTEATTNEAVDSTKEVQTNEGTTTAPKTIVDSNQKITNDKVTQKVEHVVNDIVQQQEAKDNYYESKTKALEDLKDTFKQKSNIDDTQKAKIEESVDTLQNKLNQQNDSLLRQLNASSDKHQATEQILNQFLNAHASKQLTDKILSGASSNQDIANRIQQELGQLGQTSSDDLLKGMLENTDKRQQLVENLLATRLDSEQAKQLAQSIMQGHPSNDTIVERLKANFNQNGQATSDDILNALLNNSDRKKEVIEAILGAKLNTDQARLLAESLADDIQSASDLIGFIRGELNTKANDLISIQEHVKQAREKAQNRLDWILAPLQGLPDLNLDSSSSGLQLPTPSTNERYQDLLNQGGSRLGHLGSGLFEHDFAPKPTIDPNQLIGQHTNNGLLDQLFDEQGNLRLPDTGTVAKFSWLPIGLMMVAIGTTLIWFKRRKQ
ncbi:hypothetical protein [Staphylococcus canis]|uniref:Gram-positive cocci surface proteins LPxTG domain-containing protein n=1 Tax=Staphylococcus canis TaxID=2724942 RepID=A0ABS0T782_9STAP|nr:hypothetical protein [Staphylococcus canis]MBI5974435.1 hypothetical protein [Staphylococcus canis]